MSYYKDLNLKIKERFDVNPPFPVTVELCKIAANYCLPKKKILDLGTGTGIVGIYLSKIGNEVTSTDINKNSLRLAEENCKINNVTLNLLYSDLYENIFDKFDVIIFLIPFIQYKHTYSRSFSYLYKKVVPHLVRYYTTKILYRFQPIKYYAENTRKEVVFRFLNETRNYLKNNGVVIVDILKIDLPLLKNRKDIKILEEVPSKYSSDEFIMVYKYTLHNK